MAKIVGVFYASHSFFCYRKPEEWDDIRKRRALNKDVPVDDLDTNRRKYERVHSGFAEIRRKLEEVRPDVIVIFGDDQGECFDFRNYPQFAVYVGETFEGHMPDTTAPSTDYPAGHARTKVLGHPKLATTLLSGLMDRGFDPAFCMDMPKPDKGLGHAFMHPVYSITGLGTPIVPVLVNCFFAPQPTGARCYAFGKAVREAIEAYPGDLRVALLGSGGLWHTPGAKGAWLDEKFDEACLDHLKKGDIKGLAAEFDNYHIRSDDTSQDLSVPGPRVTGMRAAGGPQSGTRELCNWIIAGAAVDGKTTTVVDCVPVYASPINVAFAYSNL
jgi:hypothetical protein